MSQWFQKKRPTIQIVQKRPTIQIVQEKRPTIQIVQEKYLFSAKSFTTNQPPQQTEIRQQSWKASAEDNCLVMSAEGKCVVEKACNGLVQVLAFRARLARRLCL